MYEDEFIQRRVWIIHVAVPAANTEPLQLPKRAIQSPGKIWSIFKILLLVKSNFSSQSGLTAVIFSSKAWAVLSPPETRRNKMEDNSTRMHFIRNFVPEIMALSFWERGSNPGGGGHVWCPQRQRRYQAVVQMIWKLRIIISWGKVCQIRHFSYQAWNKQMYLSWDTEMSLFILMNSQRGTSSVHQPS